MVERVDGMSEEEKGKQKLPKRASGSEPSASEAAGSPEAGPMGGGSPDTDDANPMGGKDAEPNRDAASSDTAAEEDGKVD